MSKRLRVYIETMVKQTPSEEAIKSKFLERAKEGLLTRDENSQTNFCVYFAGYDPQSGMVFIGHHIKSGLWLFNGGHIDKGETPMEALRREIREEWGSSVELSDECKPSLLTITKIDNPTKQKCRRHYDIWYFIPLSKSSFEPDQKLLAKEFYRTSWKSIQTAKNLIKDENTLLALEKIEKIIAG